MIEPKEVSRMTEAEIKKIAIKISKLLALATSSNANEAATAKRQAKLLMEKHNINQSDINASTVSEKHSKTGGKGRPPMYSSWLAQLIAKAFGCSTIISPGHCFGFSHIRFLGAGIKPELASYTFDVLLRQLKKHRTEYLKKLKRYKKANKTRMANIFCEEWVAAISGQVYEFAGTEQEKQAIAAYTAKKYPALTVRNPKDTEIKNNNDWGAVSGGQQAAKDVQLNRPVQTKKNTLLN